MVVHRIGHFAATVTIALLAVLGLKLLIFLEHFKILLGGKTYSAKPHLSPVTASVIIEADDKLIEHPSPVNFALTTLSSTICICKLMRSPHVGLFKSMVTLPASNVPLLRGAL
jgi:hypothetical protein